MTTLLIVDDEAIIRRGIHFHINWSANDIEVVGEAMNGEDGLQKAIKWRPDIIISDIRMPIMNGLQMAEKVKELLPDTKIIFISGYDDKEYLLGAIRGGAADFVMKSANSADILNAVLRCKEKIQAESQLDSTSNVTSMMEYCFQNIRLNFMEDIISGKMEQDIILEQAQLLELNLSGPFYLPFLIHTRESQDIDGIIMSLLFSFSTFSPFLVWRDGLGIIGIINLPSEEIPSDKCQTILKLIKEKDAGSQILTFHEPVTLDDLSYTLSRLVAETEHLCWHTGSDWIFLDKAMPGKVDLNLLLLLEQEVLQSFSRNEYIDVLGKLEQFFSFFQQHHVPLSQYRTSMERIIVGVFSLAGKYEQALPYLDSVSKLTDATEIYEVIVDMIQEFCPQIPHNAIVKMAIEYIETHYNEQIFLNDIAKYCCVTPSYISKIFKNDVSIGIVQYIHNVRIEKAKQLILNSDMKIAEIAAEVGYIDYKRFSAYFLKVTGMSPREYKLAEGS